MMAVFEPAWANALASGLPAWPEPMMMRRIDLTFFAPSALRIASMPLSQYRER